MLKLSREKLIGWWKWWRWRRFHNSFFFKGIGVGCAVIYNRELGGLRFFCWNFLVKNILGGGGGDGFFTKGFFFSKGGGFCVNYGSGKVTGSSGNAGGGTRDITLGIFGLEYCSSKKRIIYAQKKLKKDDQKVLNECVESIDFTCGDELLPDNNNYKSLRENKVSVDRRKNCSHPLEGHYYKNFDPVCFVCSTPLNPEETKLFQKRKKEYSSVIPCCKNESCIKKNLTFESGKNSG